jgi:hypothetical protein
VFHLERWPIAGVVCAGVADDCADERENIRPSDIELEGVAGLGAPLSVQQTKDIAIEPIFVATEQTASRTAVKKSDLGNGSGKKHHLFFEEL